METTNSQLVNMENLEHIERVFSMKKEEVWESVKKLDINIPFQETIFKLIDENLDRIEFVKDHIGLRDFLFMAEVDTKYYDELFLFIDANVAKSGSLEENERKIMERYESHPFDIVTSLRIFFETVERPLTIGIGFSNTEPTDEEIEGIEKLNAGLSADSKIESYRELRIGKFPRWYRENSKMPSEVKFLTLNEEEQLTHDKQIENRERIMASINKSLEDGDHTSFLKYSRQFNELFA